MNLFQIFNFKGQNKSPKQKTRRFALENLEDRMLLDAAGLLEDSVACVAAENIEPAALTEKTLTDDQIVGEYIQYWLNQLADGGTLYLNAETKDAFFDVGKKIELKKSVTIVGIGNYLVTFSGERDSQIFYANNLNGANITIKNVGLGNGGGNLGGAVQFDNSANCSLTFDNCEFYDNTGNTGGAIYTYGVNLTLNNCEFRRNSAVGTNGGGAIFMNASDANNLTINGCTFHENSATNSVQEYTASVYGGAIFMSGGTINVTGSEFYNNSASSASVFGGALSLYNMASVKFTDTDIYDNTITCTYGHDENTPSSIWNYGKDYSTSPYQVLGAGVLVNGGTNAEFTNCTITGNKATSASIHTISNQYYGYWVLGGGIFSTAATLTVDSCDISQNVCSRANWYNGGGGIFLGAGSATVKNSTITKNIVGSLEFRADDESQNGFTCGAGIWVDKNAEMTLRQDLVSENVINATSMYGVSFGSGAFNKGKLNVWDTSIVGNVTVANLTLHEEAYTWSRGAGIYNEAASDTETIKVNLYRSILMNNRIIDTADKTLYTSDLASYKTTTKFYATLFDSRYFAAETLVGYDSSTYGGCYDNAYFQKSLDTIFTSAAGGDYTLVGGSLAVDTITNPDGAFATDLLGHTRIYNGVMDMGCYEYQGTSQLPAPTVSIAGSTPRTITYSWNAIAHATSYTLQYTYTEPVLEDPSIWTSVTKITDTSFTLSGLTIGKNVWVRVQAIGDGSTYSNSPYSNIVVGKTEKIKLAAPTASASAASAYSISVSWNAVANATNYLLQYSADGTNFSDLATQTGTSYTLSNLNPGTTHYFRVRANGTGDYSNSDFSNVASAKTLTAALAKPGNFKTNSATSAAISVSWDGVANASGYQLQQSLNNKDFTTIYTGTGTSYTANNLAPGTKYYFRVCAVGDGSHYTNSDYSAASGETQAAKLAAPTNFAAAKAGSNTINVSWNGVANASSYKLLKSKDGSSFDVAYEGTGTSYSVTGLDSGTTYYFRVSAVGDGTHYTDSDYASAQAKTDAAKLAAPTNFTATATSSYAISLAWDAVANASGYQLQKSDDGETYTTVYQGTDTTYAVSSLMPGNTYYFKVFALGDGTHFTDSDNAAASATTGTTKLIAPANFTAAAAGSVTVNVSWNPSANASGYELQQKVSGAETYTTIYTGTNTSFSVEGLTPGTTYDFRICAVGDGTHYTNSDYVTTQATTETAQLAAPVLTAKTTGTAAIKLTWTAVENAQGYNLEISEDNETFTQLYNGPKLEYPATYLLSGTTYYFRIYAVGNGTQYTDSEYAFAQAKTISTQLATPEVTVKADSSSALTASWYAIAYADNYIVETSEDGETWAVKTTTGKDVRSYTVSDLNPGETRYFRVKATANTRFTDSDYGYANGTTKTEELESVTLTATAEGRTVTLEWTANDKASGYRLQQVINEEYVTIYSGSDLTYSVSDLIPGTTYSFRVCAVGDGAHYTDSDYTLAKATLATEKLSTPEISLTVVDSNNINVSWTSVENASGYRVERSFDGETYNTVYLGNDLTYTSSDLTPKMTYYYRVSAYGDQVHYTDSDYDYANAETPAQKLEVTEITGETISTYEMLISWSDLSRHATGYRLERSINGGEYEVVGNFDRHTNSYTQEIDAKHILDDTYTFRVCAFADGVHYLDSDYADVNLFACTLTPYEGKANGKAHGITVNNGDHPDDLIYYSADGENWSETPLQYTEAGTYDVYVKVCREGFQDWVSSTYIDLYAKVFRVNWTNLDKEYTYNATDQSDAISASYVDFNGVTHDANVYFSGTGEQFLNGGAYRVTTDRYVYIDGVFCGFNGKTQSVKMNKCELTVTINVTDKVYDGTTVLRKTTTTNPTYEILGLPEGQTIKLYNGHFNFDTPDVGQNKTVTFSDYAIQDVQNYRLVNETATATASITPRYVTVGWYGASTQYFYDGTDQSSKITAYYRTVFNELVQVNIDFLGRTSEATGQTEFKNVGIYRMTASMAVENPNYILTGKTKDIRMFPAQSAALPTLGEDDLFDDFDFAEEIAGNLSDELAVDYANLLK